MERSVVFKLDGEFYTATVNITGTTRDMDVDIINIVHDEQGAVPETEKRKWAIYDQLLTDLRREAMEPNE